MIDYNKYWNSRISKKYISVMPRHNEILKIIKNHKKTGKVLDLGCGEGHILNNLEEFDRYGCDITQKPFKYLDKNIKKKVCDLEKDIPYEQLFDVIICSETLEHIKNPDNIIEYISKHIKPKGLILITIPNYKNVKDKGGDSTHLNGWKISQFTKLLDEKNIEVELHYPTYFKWRFLSTARISFITSILNLIKSDFFYDWIGEQILFICFPKIKEI